MQPLHQQKETMVYVAIKELNPAVYNPRKWSKKATDDLTASIKRFGLIDPIIVNKARGNTVVGGHFRLHVAKKLGYTEVPCVFVSIEDEQKEKELNLRLNKNSGDWDWSLLKDWETSLLKEAGFDDSELKEMMDQVLEPVKEDDFDPTATLEAKETKVKLGDVWQLGKHRLMCGDSTKLEDVEKLMDGKKADMVYCDPPYGMSLDTDYSKLKGSAKSPNAKGYKWDAVIGDNEDFDPSMLIGYFSEVGEQFWWGADYFFECLPRGGSLIVWQKRDKADAAMIGNEFEICWSKTRHKKATFWKRWVGFDSIERGDKRVHPTQKPLDLHMWVLNEWGKLGDLVVDLFAGSGSTLIACEQTKRICYTMELDPKYCDVVIARWEKLTGQTATKL